MAEGHRMTSTEHNFSAIYSDESCPYHLFVRNVIRKLSRALKILPGIRISSTYNSHENIRKCMKEAIRMHLSKMLDLDKVSTRKISSAFEMHLYESAPSLISYTNTKTLHLRLRLLAVNLEKAMKRSQANPTTESFKGNLRSKQNVRTKLNCSVRQICPPPAGEFFASKRYKVLYNVLGTEIYEEIINLSSKVEGIRKSYFEQGCCNRKSPSEVSADDPTSLLNLVFHTRLINAMKLVLFNYLDMYRISNIPWEMLIGEARSNIERYESENIKRI